ncbi:hypothetical protein [Citricoccus nitrophenolicus]|uniref:hypothetical protein n=1 Tax=Citricoccus nitrophenolicus TaxID=863575 RepID=UPI0031E98D0E
MSRIEPDRIYRILVKGGNDAFAVTPDGIGCYWYESLAEATSQHGPLPVFIVRGHKAFDVLRGHDSLDDGE